MTCIPDGNLRSLCLGVCGTTGSLLLLTLSIVLLCRRWRRATRKAKSIREEESQGNAEAWNEDCTWNRASSDQEKQECTFFICDLHNCFGYFAGFEWHFGEYVEMQRIVCWGLIYILSVFLKCADPFRHQQTGCLQEPKL